MARKYEQTHPWIDFRLDLRTLTHRTWMLLGEARSKCEHIAGVPLKPQVARRLNEIYLTKGVHGTTSIEGNTLTEEEVQNIISGDLDLPPSREYQQREIKNIVDAYNLIVEDVLEGRPPELNSERIERFNEIVLDGTEVRDDVTPGRLRTDSVGVLRYRGAPAEDLEYLVGKLCQWLSEMNHGDDPEMRFALAALKSIVAHLYIAWIHPFGDGNGRVARLIEFQLLIEAGVPVPAAHLMSDFYNLTRDRYYIELDRTSRGSYSIDGFVHYAIEGFVDQLRAQLAVVREHQLEVTWENFVHDVMGQHRETDARRRQKHLLFDMPEDRPVRKAEIPELTPRLARAYAGLSTKAVARDLNALLRESLVRRRGGGYIPNRELIRAFLPIVNKADSPDAEAA